MKKLIMFLLPLISLFSCKKEGYMYKAFHAQHVPPEHYQGLDTMYVTDFFFREEKDSVAAWNWYQQTDGYKTQAPRSDSTWIEYYCTYEEWLEKGKTNNN